jgi:2-polyprenyl-6-methoxyphenol hydroxylase-like FAD-dependent oxidoreductase
VIKDQHFVVAKMGLHSDFKVVVCGGGVAGLTLANCLERAKIDYVLLEAREEIAPQLGASIGLGPNGSRILDQLGAFDIVLKECYPLLEESSWVNGQMMAKSDMPQLMEARYVTTAL